VLEVAECTIGTGGTCGSIFLNQRFESVIQKRLGDQADSILTPKRLADSVQLFDRYIKPAYNPFDSNATLDFGVPIACAPDIPDIGLEDGYLCLTE
jgi:hypothetical protein